MGFVDNFADCMVHTVSHTEFAGRTSYGERLFGSTVDYSARVIYKPTKVRTPDGREEMARGVVWLQGSPIVATEDKITLPDGTEPTIMAVDIMTDETGFSHTKIYFG